MRTMNLIYIAKDDLDLLILLTSILSAGFTDIDPHDWFKQSEPRAFCILVSTIPTELYSYIPVQF